MTVTDMTTAIIDSLKKKIFKYEHELGDLEESLSRAEQHVENLETALFHKDETLQYQTRLISALRAQVQDLEELNNGKLTKNGFAVRPGA